MAFVVPYRRGSMGSSGENHMSGGTFVWLQGSRGPYAEKRPHDMPTNDGRKESATILAEHELSANEFSLAIAILEQRYPYQAQT